MISSLLVSSLSPDPIPPNDKNPTNNLLGVGKALVAKANLTKGQTFYLVFLIVYLAFIATIAIAPTIVFVVAIIADRKLSEIQPPIPMDQLLWGLYILIGLGIIYFILYSIPEIRDRWKINKKTNT